MPVRGLNFAADAKFQRRFSVNAPGLIPVALFLVVRLLHEFDHQHDQRNRDRQQQKEHSENDHQFNRSEFQPETETWKSTSPRG